jgi:hypothetical protein
LNICYAFLMFSLNIAQSSLLSPTKDAGSCRIERALSNMEKIIPIGQGVPEIFAMTSRPLDGTMVLRRLIFCNYFKKIPANEPLTGTLFRQRQWTQSTHIIYPRKKPTSLARLQMALLTGGIPMLNAFFGLGVNCPFGPISQHTR